MQMLVGIPAREQPDEVLGEHSMQLDCIWIVMLVIEERPTPLPRQRTAPVPDLRLLSPLGAGDLVMCSSRQTHSDDFSQCKFLNSLLLVLQW